MTNKQEQGRSMVEILGALVIIGILSIAGLWMYVYLMGVHKENGTLDVIDKVAVGAYTSKDKGVEAAGERNKLLASVISSGIEQLDEYTLTTPLQTHVSAYRLEEDVYEVKLENVSYGVCSKVLNGTSDYISAYLDYTSGEGIYVGDTIEDKEAFCARVDELKREVPYIDVEENNPNANMILCYSLDSEGCDIPYTPPPPPTDRPCGVIAHGEKYNDCGLCSNGMYVMGEPIENTCYRCDAETDYKKVLREGSDCQDSCHKCDASGSCVLKDPNLPEVCGEVCCPSGECNDARDGCKKACADACNDCQYCDTNEGECKPNYTKNNTPIDDCHICLDGTITDVDDGDNKQADGKCCVGGELKYDATHCPATCSGTGDICQTCDGETGLWKYADEGKTTVCGMECCGSEGCNSLGTGCKKSCEGTGNVCQVCDDTTGEWVAVADGSIKQSDGKCCVGGELKYDATLCPASCPEGTYVKCPGSLEVQETITLEDGTECHICGCPEKTYPYNSQMKKWREGEEIAYCCDKKNPIPVKGTHWKCDVCMGNDYPCSQNKDCPTDSFCFNSGDNNGWHCHANELIKDIGAYTTVKTGGPTMFVWPSAYSRVAAKICKAKGEAVGCAEGIYSWSTNGDCIGGNNGVCKTYNESRCNNQRVKYGGVDRGTGGAVICK